MEEEGIRRDKSLGERAIGLMTGFIVITLVVLLPAMIDFFLDTPKP